MTAVAGKDPAMIEELTPQVLMISMLLIIVTAPVITLLCSVLLLWRYRRAVTDAMTMAGGFHATAAQAQPAGLVTSSKQPVADHDVTPRSNDLCRRTIFAPWCNALRYAVSGLVFALVFAGAAHFVYPHGLGLPGFLLAVWIYVWPVFLALPLVVPDSLRLAVASVAAYFLVFLLLGLWAATIADLPEYRFGAVQLAARSSVTPVRMMALWLVVNGAATLLMLLCFNRRVSAVAPLVLALVTIALAGALAGIFALFSPPGVDAVVALSVSLHMHVYAILLVILLLSLFVFGALGWSVARWIARAYRHRRLSDQSLLLDALWLLFASIYSMWLVWGGLVWIATAPVAFLAGKLAWIAVASIQAGESKHAPGLTFLRVFSLGRRSEALFGTVARYWRHIGSVQMITGPDVAGSTVQPHQFLDYLSGRLSRHFVHDHASLERSLAAREHTVDPDGRFRINNFFCHADSWQAVLPHLVQQGDTVLMDLRNFSAASSGCLHELRYLLQEVPMGRCLLVVDNTTDRSFLRHTLQEEWDRLPPGSPNRAGSPEQAELYHLDTGSAPVRRLVQRLCAAASG